MTFICLLTWSFVLEMSVTVGNGQTQQYGSLVEELYIGHWGLVKYINHASECLLYPTIETNWYYSISLMLTKA